MANWKVAYGWMLANEDFTPPRYEVVKDTGGQAISGINSAVFPLQFAKIAALPQAERGVEVETFYRAAFWNKWFDQIESDEVAKRVFDAAVNMGPSIAVKLLQRAILQLDPDANFSADGIWGPHTIMRVNIEDADKLVTAFCAQRCDHYQHIVEANPSDAQYLEAWLARARK